MLMCGVYVCVRSQSDASVDAKVGGKFSWFGGSVQVR